MLEQSELGNCHFNSFPLLKTIAGDAVRTVLEFDICQRDMKGITPNTRDAREGSENFIICLSGFHRNAPAVVGSFPALVTVPLI